MEFYSIIYGAAVHMIDLILWIIGMRPVEVQGYGNGVATGTALSYNDFAAILMKFEDGTVAKVSANGGCVHPHFHRLSVFGTGKTFVHDILGAKWIDSNDPKAESRDADEEYPANEKKGKVITTFIDSILDERAEAVVPCEDVFNTMSVCFAAERSIHDKKPVAVEYI
jgi:predicted dehydrogenase